MKFVVPFAIIYFVVSSLVLMLLGGELSLGAKFIETAIATLITGVLLLIARKLNIGGLK